MIEFSLHDSCDICYAHNIVVTGLESVPFLHCSKYDSGMHLFVKLRNVL